MTFRDLAGSLRRRAITLRQRLRRRELPLHGHDTHRNAIPFVDSLSDDDLRSLNRLLDWQAFVADSKGRRFGNSAWAGKRDTPQPIPDPRVTLLDERLSLREKHVLEIGCFEGIHTVALTQRAARVTAVDGRIENVVKTIVRCALFDVHPAVFVHDVDAAPLTVHADVVFHVGVLYHLNDPVRHLRQLSTVTARAILLDTHYATAEEATETYTVDGRGFRYRRFVEGGRADVFSGLYDDAKWLTLDDLQAILRQGGFSSVEVIELRQERNGARVLLLATKPT